MQGVFNPNILIYHPPNSAEGLHFSAFHYYGINVIFKHHLRVSNPLVSTIYDLTKVKSQVFIYKVSFQRKLH